MSVSTVTVNRIALILMGAISVLVIVAMPWIAMGKTVLV